MTGGRQVLIGADGVSYRTVPSHTLLSPDGRRAFLPAGRGRLTALDLTTGRQRHYRIPGGGNATAMAVSADGRLAVVGSTPDPRAGGAALVEPRLLDLGTGRSTPLPESAFRGWAADDRIVVFENGSLRGRGLWAGPKGPQQELSKLSNEGGELVDDLAEDLLDEARTGTGSADFWPMPGTRLLAGAGLVLLVPLAVSQFRRWRARRRPSPAR